MRLTFKEFLAEAKLDLSHLDDRWFRKPDDWHEIEGRVHTVTVQDSKQAGFDPENLPHYDISDLYHSDPEHKLPRPHDDFDETPNEQVFMLAVPGEGSFLINRSGYDYVRYAMKFA